MESLKLVEILSERSYVFLITSTIDWIERVKIFISFKVFFFKVSLWKFVDGDYFIISKIDLLRYDLRLVLVSGVVLVLLYVFADGNYIVKVLFRDIILKGILKEEEDIFFLIVVMENCEVCFGFKLVLDVNLVIKRIWGFFFERIDSNKCLLFYLSENKK